MTAVMITIGNDRFEGAFQDHLAPDTCQRFRSLLPWRRPLIHVRWSGEGCWIPLGDFDFGVGAENPTRHPAPGEFILYPGGVSETEILVAYGAVSFASKAGPLAGNPLLKVDQPERLAAIGRRILWEGASDISFDLC